jgi:Zn-dependent metalloprotease
VTFLGSKKQRISALAATAALVAAGVTAQTAGAATAEQHSDVRAGAQIAPLSQSTYTKLVKQADSPEATAAAAKALGLGKNEQLHAKSVVKDKDGTEHVHYERTFDGMPVLGGDLIVHKSKSGKTKGVTKATKADIAVDSSPSTLADTKPATPKAKGSEAPRKVVWAADGKPVLAWETVVGGTQKDGTPNRMHVITDARSGKKLAQWQGIETGTGTGQSMYSGTVELGTSGSSGAYKLTDEGRGGSSTYNLDGGTSGKGTLFTDDDNKWGDGTASDPQTAAVDAAYGVAQTWDFYKDVFGRNGIRNDGVGAYSRVHYGNGYQNAFWSDDCFCMTYGDGANNANPLTELDVAGHEMTHGVTSATAGLEYRGESGGLNEATSDIMGTAVEFHANNSEDTGDYLIGEEIDLMGNGEPLRYMDQPSKDGASLDHWSSSAGNVDVHYSSGIANHFFYLLSEGSGPKDIGGVHYDSPTYDGSTVTGIGREKAVAIWYKALTEQMTSTTDYADARKATVTAATDLYGADSTEVSTVKAAWTAVNVK